MDADSPLPTFLPEALHCGYYNVSSTASPHPHYLHGQEPWRMEEGWGPSLIDPFRELLAWSGLEDLGDPGDHKLTFPLTIWGGMQAEYWKLWIWIEILVPTLTCWRTLGQPCNFPMASIALPVKWNCGAFSDFIWVTWRAGLVETNSGILLLIIVVVINWQASDQAAWLCPNLTKGNTVNYFQLFCIYCNNIIVMIRLKVRFRETIYIR